MQRLGIGFIVAASLVGSVASAQFEDRRNLDANRLRWSQSQEGVLNVEVGAVPKHLEWDLSLWGDYANDTLTLNQGGDRIVSLLRDRADAHLLLALGLFDRLQIGLDVPFTVYQRRGPKAVNVFELQQLKSTGLGDLAITPKVGLFSGPLDIALLARVTVPTATPRNNYLGERSVTVTPELAVSKSIMGFTVAGNVAALFRDNVPTQTLDVDHELLVRLGASFDFNVISANLPLRADVTVEGSTQLKNPFEYGNADGGEWLAGLGYGINDMLELYIGGGTAIQAAYSVPDFRAFAGLRAFGRNKEEQARPAPEPEPEPVVAPVDTDGDGLLDNADKCPNEAEDKDGFADEDGCPDPDNDNDGILDAADQCSSEPEDKDGFQDDDGCPDTDNDSDGILDAKDQCPNEPEDIDKFQDDDGCPDLDNDGDSVPDTVDNCPLERGSVDNAGCIKKQLVTIKGCRIDLSQKVFFTSGKARIETKSFALLDNIASLLKAQDQIKKIRIEGHTDDKGSDAKNKKLSQERADAVKAFLVKAGIDESRLTSVGFGEERPIAPNASARGRETNRRVEFIMSDCEEVKSEIDLRTSP